jgi:septal ring factor EnvC (AmiA/AmiB activator)
MRSGCLCNTFFVKHTRFNSITSLSFVAVASKRLSDNLDPKIEKVDVRISGIEEKVTKMLGDLDREVKSLRSEVAESQKILVEIRATVSAMKRSKD